MTTIWGKEQVRMLFLSTTHYTRKSDRFLIFLYTAGDAKNEVLTGLSKLKYDPALYRANALQGLVYDPASKFHHLYHTSGNVHSTLCM